MSNQHKMTDFVQDERDREAAAEVMKRAFPDNLKRWGRDQKAISRARKGDVSNPVYRLRRYVRRGLRSGMPRDQATLIAVDLLVLIEEECTNLPADFQSASRIEQQLDGAEDVAQQDALVDPEKLPEFIIQGKQEIAALAAAVATAERAHREHVRSQLRLG